MLTIKINGLRTISLVNTWIKSVQPIRVRNLTTTKILGGNDAYHN